MYIYVYIILKYKIEKDSGYLRTCLRGGLIDNAIFSTHRLVALAFIPNPVNKPQVNHKKGIKTDNRAISLDWSTAKENNDHAILNDLKSDGKGENHHLVKLSEKEVLEIRKINRSISLSKIAKIYKISKTTVSRVLLRKIWNHI